MGSKGVKKFSATEEFRTRLASILSEASPSAIEHALYGLSHSAHVRWMQALELGDVRAASWLMLHNLLEDAAHVAKRLR